MFSKYLNRQKLQKRTFVVRRHLTCSRPACLEEVGFILVQVTNIYVFNRACVTQSQVSWPMLKAIKAEATKEFRERSDKLKMMGYEIKLCSSMVDVIGQDYRTKEKISTNHCPLVLSHKCYKGVV